MTPLVTDEQLLRRIGAQDRDAFTILWRRLGAAVLSLCVRVLGDQHAAEDATQETFATIWRAAGTFDPERGTAASWIFTIARNAARDGLRRRRATPIADPPEVSDPAASPHDQAAAAFDSFVVHTAVASLNPRWREVLELAYFQGLSQSEIAEQTDTPLGTVKTRTRNALANLAERLEQVGQPS
jgi:RNA polymerase sigma-70 factor, ECF subfamily